MKYTKQDFLKAAKKGEVSMIDAKHIVSLLKPQTLNIKLTEYAYPANDGCCLDFGTITTINGKELPCNSIDTVNIIKQILTHLGYKVNITQEFPE